MPASLQATEQAELTCQESLQLVRCLLRVSVFHVSYLRGLFPPSLFRQVQMNGLDGMSIQMLKPQKNTDAETLVNWIENGVHEALERKFLATMTFGVCSDPEQTEILEEFLYSFNYDCENTITMTSCAGPSVAVKMSQPSQNDMKTVKASIITLMRVLIHVCQTLDPLPNKRYIFMKLTYTNDTPAEYEPAGFRAYDDADLDHFPQRPFMMFMGNMKTKHHGVSLTVKSIFDPLEDSAAQTGAEGQNSTLIEALNASKLNDCVDSGKGSMEEVAELPQPDPAALLEDVRAYCKGAKRSTVDFTQVMSSFVHVDIASLDRCFEQLVKDGTLVRTDKKDLYKTSTDSNRGTALFEETVVEAEQQMHAESLGGAPAGGDCPLTPITSGSRKGDMQTSHAGSARTCSTTKGKQAPSAPRQQQQHQHEQSPQQSTMLHFGTQQSNDKESRKRKSSCAAAPIQQGTALGKTPKRVSRLRMMHTQEEQLLQQPED